MKSKSIRGDRDNWYVVVPFLSRRYDNKDDQGREEREPLENGVVKDIDKPRIIGEIFIHEDLNDNNDNS